MLHYRCVRVRAYVCMLQVGRCDNLCRIYRENKILLPGLMLQNIKVPTNDKQYEQDTILQTGTFLFNNAENV